MAFTPSRSGPPGAPFPGSRGRGRFRHQQPNTDEHRVNERIRVPEVRLIDADGRQIGVVPTRDALSRAQELGLDLMEVSPNSKPPVCKILDYGKFKYEKKKKEHQAKKNQTIIKVKEVQLRPNTETHDLDYKFKNVRTFLEDGDKVKVTMMFRGRQITHSERGFEVVNQLLDEVKDIGEAESKPKLEGRRLIVIIAPRAAKKPKTSPKPAKPKDVKVTKEGSGEAKEKKKA